MENRILFCKIAENHCNMTWMLCGQDGVVRFSLQARISRISHLEAKQRIILIATWHRRSSQLKEETRLDVAYPGRYSPEATREIPVPKQSSECLIWMRLGRGHFAVAEDLRYERPRRFTARTLVVRNDSIKEPSNGVLETGGWRRLSQQALQAKAWTCAAFPWLNKYVFNDIGAEQHSPDLGQRGI